MMLTVSMTAAFFIKNWKTLKVSEALGVNYYCDQTRKVKPGGEGGVYRVTSRVYRNKN